MGKKLAGPDGKKNGYSRRFSPVLDSNKNVTLVLVYGIDITQRRLAEDTNKAKRRKIPDADYQYEPGACRVNKDGIILFANQTFAAWAAMKWRKSIGRETLKFYLEIQRRSLRMK